MVNEPGNFWLSPNPRQQKIKGWILTIVFTCYLIDEMTKVVEEPKNWSGYAWMTFYIFGVIVGIFLLRGAYKKGRHQLKPPAAYNTTSVSS